MTLLKQAEELNCTEARAYDRMPSGVWLFRCKRNGAKTDREKCRLCEHRRKIKDGENGKA